MVFYAIYEQSLKPKTPQLIFPPRKPSHKYHSPNNNGHKMVRHTHRIYFRRIEVSVGGRKSIGNETMKESRTRPQLHCLKQIQAVTLKSVKCTQHQPMRARS